MAPPKTPPVAAKRGPADSAAPAIEIPVPQRFEDAVAELEQIVAAMETGSLALEESLARFQRGSQLLRHCREALESAEQRIRILQNGELVDLPVDRNGNE
jgi:exodeoxyribonuclease VII small subunit